MKLLDEFEQTISIDCLLLAGGSDHRAYEVLRKCSANKFVIKKILLFDFPERTSSLEENDKYFDYKKTGYNNFEHIECTI